MPQESTHHRLSTNERESGPSALIASIARHARQRPGSIAVDEVGADSEFDRACTYDELAALTEFRAQQLVDVTAPGDVVVAILPSGFDYVAWFCAAIAAGVKLLPMHTQIASAEAASVALRARATLAICAPGIAAMPAMEHLTRPALGAGGSDQRHVGDHRRLALLRERPGAIVLGSSGTTGMPKLALRSGESLEADAVNVIAGTKLGCDDRLLMATPLCHSYGVDMLVGALTAGASLTVAAHFDLKSLAERLCRGVTILAGVPFVFEALARVPTQRPSKLRLVLSAGSRLSPRVREAFTRAWGIEIGQLYGATELGAVSMDIPDSDGFDPLSIGRPLSRVSMRVVDPDNPQREVEHGEEGELAVAAPSMLDAYLDGRVPMVDGHFLTGDLARMSGDGRVYITGRLKLLIDVGAYKVNPLEVEAELMSHPNIAECVVAPMVISDTQLRLRAVCVLRDPLRSTPPESLRRFLRDRLSPVKVPRIVEIVESLPKSPTGKVLRAQA